MTAMISVASGDAVVGSLGFSTLNADGRARISAIKGARYVLAEADKESAAVGVTVERSGDDLLLTQHVPGSEDAWLTIEDFFAGQSQLLGIGSQGRYEEYPAVAKLRLAGAVEAGHREPVALSLLPALPALAPLGLASFNADATAPAGAPTAKTDAVDVVVSNANVHPAAAQHPGAVSSAVLIGPLEDAVGHAPTPESAETGVDGAVQRRSADIGAHVSDVAAEMTADAGVVQADENVAGAASTSVSLNENGGGVAQTTTVFGIDDLPEISAVLDDQGLIQGVIENGGYTDDGRPQMVGKAEEGVLVHIYRGSELIGQVFADANGDWAFTPRLPLADGRHVITIIHEYPDGDVSDVSPPYVIHVDKSVPETPLITGILDDEGRITGVISEHMITDDNRPTIDGTAEAHATVIIYDKGKQIGTAEVDADGNWSFTPDLPLVDGTHLLSYAAIDRAGNASEPSSVFEFVVDTRPEKINIFVADDDVGSVQGAVFSGAVTDDNTPTLTGSATAGGIVSIYEGAVLLGQVTADVDGTWQFTPSALSEGAHTFHATVTLVAKGESEPSKLFNLTVDLTPPSQPSIEQVLDDVGAIVGLVERDGRTDDAMPTLSGKAEAGSTVHIHDNGKLLGSTLADANGSWTFTPALPLSDDTHIFTVTAEDKAGNLSEASDPFAVTIDTVEATKPTIDSVYDDVGSKTGLLVSGDETDDFRPDISGTADPGSTVIIRDHGVEIGRVQANAEGKWAFTPAANLAEGVHALTAESVTADGKISQPSDRFDFSVVHDGDDYPPELNVSTANFNTTLVIDNSGSMAGSPMVSVKAALTQLASEYLLAAAGAPITLTMLTMSNIVPVKYTFSSSTDLDYIRYMAAVSSMVGVGGPDYEAAIKAAMGSIKADHQGNNGPSQVFILGDAQNSLNKATADQWQAMLVNPTGSATLPTPIQSTPISFLAFPHSKDYSFHWLATGGEAIDMPTAEMMPEILLGSAVGESVAGNLLDNDAKLIQDGNEYLTQISFEGGTFRVSPGNSLVMSNVPEDTKGSYDPTTGLLTITTSSGSLRVYMKASTGHAAGDYVYASKLVQIYHGESVREETFNYIAVDGSGVSQSANLHIVLHPSDVRDLLKISTLGKDSGVQDDFVTSDGSAGREVSGTLTRFLATGLKVQVSVDGGLNWQDAVTNGRNWSLVDMSAHSGDWMVQVRISDGVIHGTQILSQEVTLVGALGAPVISSIPDAVGVYTTALALDGSEMTVLLSNTGAKMGDIVHIQWGIATYDQTLTALDIINGSVTLNVPAAITYGTKSYNYDFAVTAQIIGQNGALGAVSDPFDVVGTYARAMASDALQLAPIENVYFGNGVNITTTGAMAKTTATTNNAAGLTITDKLQATATFTLSKPADYIELGLSGAENARGAHVRVYDVNGELMYEKLVFGGTTTQHLATFSWTKTGPVDIGSFTVTAMSASVTLSSFKQYVVTHTSDTRDPNLIDILSETFYGSAGDDVVSLGLSSATYFNQATAAVHGGAGIDTLKLVGGGHVLDLSTMGNKLSSMEIIDITGSASNALTLNLSNVLNNGGPDLFHIGDKSRVQMMVKGNANDKVNLGDLLFGGVDQGDWLQKSAVVIDGVSYISYQHSSLDAEVLVQSGVTVALLNTATVGATAALFVEGNIAVVSDLVVPATEEVFAAGSVGATETESSMPAGTMHYAQNFGAASLELHDARLEAY